MPYKISQFDGVDLPDFLQRSDVQNMGVGRATSDFVQMPGGGFFDNYGDFDSPRELTAITKQCEFRDTGGSSIETQVEAMRAKLGKRGRLEMTWHNDDVRWTWARLVGVETPRPFNTRLTTLPVTLTWMPAAGIWYAEDEVVEETVFATTTTAEDIAITHPGTANVVDAVLEFVSPYNGALTITVENYATSQQMSIPLAGIDVDETIVIDVGQRTARLHHLPVDIDTLTRSGTTLTVDCAAAHGLSVGDSIRIRETDYDGFYTVDSVTDTDTFTVECDPLVKAPHGPQTPAAGLVWEVDNIFSNITFSDEADWFWLVPGSNTIHVTATHDMDTGTFRVTYNPAYS